jgi:hypothetical protein
MTGEEYKDALASLGLSVNDGARFLRMRKDTSARIAAGEDFLGWPRVALLRMMAAYRISVEEVEELMQDFEGDE